MATASEQFRSLLVQAEILNGVELFDGEQLSVHSEALGSQLALSL